MDNLLIQEELLSLLKEATQASHVQLEPCVWQNAYENFCRHAEKLTESECSSKVMRTIDHARIELEQIPKRLYAGKHGKIDPVGTDEIDPVKTA